MTILSSERLMELWKEWHETDQAETFGQYVIDRDLGKIDDHLVATCPEPEKAYTLLFKRYCGG